MPDELGDVSYKAVAAHRAQQVTELVRELEELRRQVRADAQQQRQKVATLTARVADLRSRLAAEQRAVAELSGRRLVRWSLRLDAAVRRPARRLGGRASRTTDT